MIDLNQLFIQITIFMNNLEFLLKPFFGILIFLAIRTALKNNKEKIEDEEKQVKTKNGKQLINCPKCNKEIELYTSPCPNCGSIIEYSKE